MIPSYVTSHGHFPDVGKHQLLAVRMPCRLAGLQCLRNESVFPTSGYTDHSFNIHPVPWHWNDTALHRFKTTRSVFFFSLALSPLPSWGSMPCGDMPLTMKAPQLDTIQEMMLYKYSFLSSRLRSAIVSRHHEGAPRYSKNGNILFLNQPTKTRNYRKLNESSNTCVASANPTRQKHFACSQLGNFLLLFPYLGSKTVTLVPQMEPKKTAHNIFLRSVRFIALYAYIFRHHLKRLALGSNALDRRNNKKEASVLNH